LLAELDLFVYFCTEISAVIAASLDPLFVFYFIQRCFYLKTLVHLPHSPVKQLRRCCRQLKEAKGALTVLCVVSATGFEQDSKPPSNVEKLQRVRDEVLWRL
jgi:hypothetical protein